MKNILRITARVLIGVLIAALCALLVISIIPLTETENTTGVEGSADWMSGLDDSLPLSEVVLPGTHDSATKYDANRCKQARNIPKPRIRPANGNVSPWRRKVGGEIFRGFTSRRRSNKSWN